jgi:hypothetical protein
MRSAIGSMPLTALMTMAAVSTASSAGSDWRAGRVDEVHARAGKLQVHHRRVERMLRAPLQRVEVADCAAALQRARHGDGAGAVQQRFGQAGLAGRGRPHEGQGSDAGDGVGHRA